MVDYTSSAASAKELRKALYNLEKLFSEITSARVDKSAVHSEETVQK